MCKNLYEITKSISDKIEKDSNIAPDAKVQDVSKYIKRTLESMAFLFAINIQDENGKKYNIPDELATLVEIEVLYRKQKNTPKTKILKTLIGEIIDNQWDKIKADDLRSFFLPIFNSDYIKDVEYLQNFKNKLNACLDCYSIITPNCMPAYLRDDITSFINCIYYQKKLPTRDYQKLLDIINSGEA
ncbi:hypothetical protein AALA90_15165 [Lachnospiraceae bacterium 38-10]